MRYGEVELSPETAAALNALGIVGHMGTLNIDLPDMAWLAWVLRHIPDDHEYFPLGKWATIEDIKDQVRFSAKHRAAEVIERLMRG